MGLLRTVPSFGPNYNHIERNDPLNNVRYCFVIQYNADLTRSRRRILNEKEMAQTDIYDSNHSIQCYLYQLDVSDDAIQLGCTGI